MRFQAAVIREQGITFAVVVVKRHVINDRGGASRVIESFVDVFGGIPVVLMAQDFRGRAEYLGRQDIARFLASIPMRAIPWRWYDLNHAA